MATDDHKHNKSTTSPETEIKDEWAEDWKHDNYIPTPGRHKDSPFQPLVGARFEDETDLAVTACNDFLRMGPGRKLIVLAMNYADDKYTDKPPTKSYNVLQNWSQKFDWPTRATYYNKAYDAYKTTMTSAALETGVALTFERVLKLKRLESLLLTMITGGDAGPNASQLWLDDVKQTGSGKTAEVHTLQRFNSALVDQYRKILDDIAQETGGRQKGKQRGTKDAPLVLKVLKDVSLDDL